MTEDSQYDEIFTALKHPVRRQILMFIDSKGEASFTEIQQETGITDTGLMSYHLKGLTSLIEQSKRGKYQLSEVGQAGVELFRKADRERERTSTIIHKEIEQFIGLSIKKSVFFLLILGWSFFVPSMFDIYFSVNVILRGYTFVELTMILLVTLAVMILGVFLFTIFDRRYYSKTTKGSIMHSLLFTFVFSVQSVLLFNSLNRFTEGTLGLPGQTYASGSLPWSFEILKLAIFNASAPAIVYGLCKFSHSRSKTKRMA